VGLQQNRGGVLTKGAGNRLVWRGGGGQGARLAGHQALPSKVAAGGVLATDALARVGTG